MTKTQRFRVSFSYLISKEKIFMFIKPASLMQKRRKREDTTVKINRF